MIHFTAYVAPSAKLDAEIEIGPYCFIGENVSIAKGSRLMAFVTIEAGASIGAQCLIYPHVMIYHQCQIQDSCVIYPHSVIGSNGFGYATDAQGFHHYIPQTGIAILQNNVHFGPQAFIDRAALDESVIGEHSHIGAFSHIAHNSSIGKNSKAYNDLIVAGSTKIGNQFETEGRAAVTGHIQLGNDIRLKAVSAINNSENNPGYYQGFPHEPVEKYHERLEAMKHLPRLRHKILKLKRETT